MPLWIYRKIRYYKVTIDAPHFYLEGEGRGKELGVRDNT